MHVTAYDLSYESCEKYPDHPVYGITASGRYVEDGRTIAMGPSFPFGTMVWIPNLAWLNGTGIFECHDRGGAIDNSDIDVYVGGNQLKMYWSDKMEVYIIE